MDAAPNNADPKSAEKSAAQFRIYRARDSRELGGGAPADAPPATDEVSQTFAAVADGYVIRSLFSDRDAGVSLVYCWFKPHYALPRHSHEADCLYYVVSGSLQIGTEVLEAGDGFLVPKNGLYAYQAGPEGVEVLEFRTSTRFGIEVNSPSAALAKIREIGAAQSAAWRALAPPPAARRILEKD